jgi:HK97 family phage portal protein
MKILGKVLSLPWSAKASTAVTTFNGFFDSIKESFSGAWQKGIIVDRDQILAHSAVYSCISLISADIGKLKPSVLSKKGSVWVQEDLPEEYKVLEKPNNYQTWQKLVEAWISSKLMYGNAYIYKEYEGKILKALHVLHPKRCLPYVTTTGEVYYQLQRDDLAQIRNLGDQGFIPSRLVIHDTMVSLFHPLIGVSPIYACGLSATQGLAIQKNSALFFENMSRPSGMLTAPASIKDETARRLKEYWEKNFSGGNIGNIAVLGDGLKYEAMTINAVDAQLIEQLRWTAENVCTCFHMPAYKIGVGPMPTYNNGEMMNQAYYSDCLQALIESLEAHLDIGLNLDRTKKFELDLEGLLRMDTATQIEVLDKQVKGGWLAPNEAREKVHRLPVKGGETPYLQQQNYSLSALAERDNNDPFAKTPAVTEKPEEVDLPNDEDLEELEDTKLLIGTNLFLKAAASFD